MFVVFVILMAIRSLLLFIFKTENSKRSLGSCGIELVFSGECFVILFMEYLDDIGGQSEKGLSLPNKQFNVCQFRSTLQFGDQESNDTLGSSALK